jgi:hypothetical protein
MKIMKISVILVPGMGKTVLIPNQSDSKLSDTCRLFSNFLCYLLKYSYTSSFSVYLTKKLQHFGRTLISKEIVQDVQLLQTG